VEDYIFSFFLNFTFFMKKVILTAAAALALFATTFAQSATAPAPKAKMTKAKPATEAAAAQGTPAPTAEAGKTKGKAQGENRGQGQGGMKALGLSPEQETQFKTLNQAHKAAVKAVQSDASLAADAKKAQVAALVTKYESDVQGMMNADQFAKWTAARAKRDEKKMEGDHKGGDHKKGDHKMDAPAEGTAAPAEGAKMKKNKNKKEQN
jgi:hypothetical protein